MPDQATVRRALERAEFVVVQEAFATTATCAYADLLLPATTWGEKEGTVTNSERRISRVRAAVPRRRARRATTGTSPSTSRSGWKRCCAAARAGHAGLTTLFPYTTPEADLERTPRIHPRPRPGHHRPELRHAGRSARSNGRCPKAQPQGQARLYEDGVFPTADGRRASSTSAYQPVAEPRDARYPFSLTTGRLRDQWHGMSRTGTLGRLFGHVREPACELHPQDMARRL